MTITSTQWEDTLTLFQSYFVDDTTKNDFLSYTQGAIEAEVQEELENGGSYFPQIPGVITDNLGQKIPDYNSDVQQSAIDTIKDYPLALISAQAGAIIDNFVPTSAQAELIAEQKTFGQVIESIVAGQYADAVDNFTGPVAETSLAMKTLAKGAMIAAVLSAGIQIYESDNPDAETVKQGIVVGGALIAGELAAGAATFLGASTLVATIPALVIGGIVGAGLTALYDPVIKPYLDAHELGDLSSLANTAADYIDDLWEQTGQTASGFFDDIVDGMRDMNNAADQLADDYGWALDNPDAIWGELPPWLLAAKSPIDASYHISSPLVLDLDGDGVETSALGSGNGGSRTYFDLDNDGFAERTGWAAGGDGLLALDKNNNGKIDDKGELFGDSDVYADGFAALKALDSNNDGKITASDAQWSKLRVWVDADGDGMTDAGELKTLSALKITQVNLNAAAQSGVSNNGNPVTASSTFVMNGQTRTVSDVWFRNDPADTRYLGEVTLNAKVLFLPTLKGFGELKDLHVAHVAA